MKKYFVILVVFSFFFYSCKEKKNNNIKREIVIDSPIVIISDTINSKQKTQLAIYNLKKILNTIKNIKHTGNKHADWMTNNNSFFLAKMIETKIDSFQVKTTSFTYKNDCIFYLHTLKHTNDTISIKSFIENAQGKYTEGYMGVRVLIFTMKNSKEANFIDIPLTSGQTKLHNELIKKVYNKIDFDVIACDSTKMCVYKDSQKIKSFLN